MKRHTNMYNMYNLRSRGLWVRIPPVAAVYQCQLNVPSLRGRLMSSSLRATGWRPSAADWGGGMSVVLRCGSSCPLSQAMDGSIPCHGTTSSCQSAATSKIVKRCCSRVFSGKQRYIRYPDLYLYQFTCTTRCRNAHNTECNLSQLYEFSLSSSSRRV